MRREWVHAVTSKGNTYFYYRRNGSSERLPGPENSAAFLEVYDRIHNRYSGASTTPHTVAAAIAHYKEQTDYTRLKLASKRLYDMYLEEFAVQAGHLPIADIDNKWASTLRNSLAKDVHRWNRIRSLMNIIWSLYGLSYESAVPRNPWIQVKRLKVEESDQNRAWPEDLIVRVMQEATPEFRALLTCLLLMTQRIGDVCAWPEAAYDPKARTLTFEQEKTGQPMHLRVPDVLAEIFESMRGRVPGKLLCTPRGYAWTRLNAEETLRVLLKNLGVGRFTLHGMRATGPSKAYGDGADIRALMAITGHTTEANIKKYLRWVAHASLAAKAGKKIERLFMPTIRAGLKGANTRSYSGITGKAAAKAGIVAGRRTKPAM